MKMIRTVAWTLLALVACLGKVSAEEKAAEMKPPRPRPSETEPGKPEPIVTDRPDFTEAAVVVPARFLQIENGFTYENGRRVYTLSGSETLFRYGVDRRFEVRLGLPNFISQRAAGVTARGIGDTYLGAKWQLGPTKDGTDVALIPAVFVPTGPRDSSSRSVDPEVKLCVSRELSDRWALSGMLYGALPTEGGRRNPTLQSTLSLGHSLGGGWSVFFEYVGTFARHSGPQHLYHSGFAYQLNPDAQFDIHYGFGLNGNAPASFVAAGISVRFGPK